MQLMWITTLICVILCSFIICPASSVEVLCRETHGNHGGKKGLQAGCGWALFALSRNREKRGRFRMTGLHGGLPAMGAVCRQDDLCGRTERVNLLQELCSCRMDVFGQNA